MKPFLNWLAATASVVGLFFTISPFVWPLTQLQYFIVLVTVIIFVVAAARDIRDDLKKSAKKYKSTAEINNYMYEMLKTSGACEICSRDASWISEDRIYSLLESKATRGELTFLVHKKTKEVEKLEQNGATIIEYGKLGFDPITRFTVANSGNQNSSYVAVGGKKPNEHHIIEELDTSHPIHSMATDLIRSIKIANVLSKKA
jgi:hypothetical protein